MSETETTTLATLASATELGQSVAGTTSGSVYVCVALSESAAMAIRVNHATYKVSVRVEPIAPSTVPSIMDDTKAMGLTPSPPTHASIHVSCGAGRSALMSVAAYVASFYWQFGGTVLPLDELRTKLGF